MTQSAMSLYRRMGGYDVIAAVIDAILAARRRWRSVWRRMRWSMSGRWRRCGGCIGTRRVDRWWRWSRDRGSSRRGSPVSSAFGIERVAPRTVMRRFDIVITPPHAIAVDRPVRPMGWGSVSGATTPKEAPGWSVTTADENGVHTAEFVTPTGMRYRSTAPALPGTPLITVSELEVRVGVALADLHAA
jgi:hypothetical protein